jgi:DNA polymerase-3 subunit gamma/tau
MASQALYRKWRSQTFSDLIGQEPVVRALKNGLRSGRIAHAYLFCGPRGTGKTSTARLLAKTLNCQNPQDGEPCNTCPNCREITEGRSLDVIEIDAASNGRVDEIRELRERVPIGPGSSTYKVYVLDEAHMLTDAACNALLKTLEEPPPHVIFVLATTEAHRMLSTIVSRCQRFDFKRFSLREIIGRLQYVAQQEGWSLEPGATELLARAAAGGMRDALGLLDRAVATMGTTVTSEGVQQMLGLADPRLVGELVGHIAHLRGAEGLHLINRLAEAGADLRQLSAQVADYWRALLLAKAGADLETVLDRMPEDVAEIRQLAGLFTLDELSACARLFSQNDVGARSISIPQLAVELAFVDCLHLHRQRTDGGTQPPDGPGSRSGPTPAQHPASAPTSQPAQRPPSPRPAPFTPDTSRQPPRSSAIAPTAPPPDPSPTARSEEAVNSAWSFEGEAPEPLIPELRSYAASFREPSQPLSGASAQASPPIPVAAPAPMTAQAVSAQPDEEAGWDEDDGGGIAAEAGEGGAGQAAVSLSLSDVTRQWELVKKACKTKSPKLAALLNNAAPVAVLPGKLPEVVVQVEFEFHYKQLAEPVSRQLVIWAFEQILRMPCQIQLLQKHEPIPTSGTFVASTAGASPVPARQQPASPTVPPMGSGQPIGMQPFSAPVQSLTNGGGSFAQESVNGTAHKQPPNEQAQAASAPSSLPAAALTAPQHGAALPRRPQPSADLLKETVLRDPVVEEVIRTYDASLVEWKPLEE